MDTGRTSVFCEFENL